MFLGAKLEGLHRRVLGSIVQVLGIIVQVVSCLSKFHIARVGEIVHFSGLIVHLLHPRHHYTSGWQDIREHLYNRQYGGNILFSSKDFRYLL